MCLRARFHPSFDDGFRFARSRSQQISAEKVYVVTLVHRAGTGGQAVHTEVVAVVGIHRAEDVDVESKPGWSRLGMAQRTAAMSTEIEGASASAEPKPMELVTQPSSGKPG